MRFDIDSFRETGDSLVRNKRRTILTGFGVFWGLFMLLFMIGGGRGLKGVMSNIFEGFATNMVVIYPQYTSKPYKGFAEGRFWDMTLTDIKRLEDMVPELETVSPTIGRWGVTAEYGNNSFNSASVKGVLPNYAKVETPRIKYGRFLNQVDQDQSRKVCVIGKRIYQSLFPDGGDPCGKFIRVGSVYMQIVGVDFKAGEQISINGSASQSIAIPLSVAAKLYNRGNTVDMMCVTGRSGIKMSTLENRIRSIMAREHIFDSSDEEAMMYLNVEQIFRIVDNLFRGLDFLIWLVGLGTLLAGCIGVSNIMMVTVKERTIEIGIRRAIGAMPGEILSQIITESIALTLAAGTVGIVFAVMLLEIFEKVIDNGTVFQIGFNTAILATALLTLLGALAGLAPALRAMAIKPVDAIRDE
ncbi:MAG: ABC transporter permease [Bacteroidaceae bacterium]|jgi:putative ABC transport system permease protein|nr:ABC transporter permease [Bacteroidaceae bacterium]MBP8602356.1 ABC transporter permease [Bacteroidaceae bacterium]